MILGELYDFPAFDQKIRWSQGRGGVMGDQVFFLGDGISTFLDNPKQIYEHSATLKR